jgi:hypothetical protein
VSNCVGMTCLRDVPNFHEATGARPESVTSTIIRGYDGLEDLTSETTPQISINYRLDAADRYQPSAKARTQSDIFFWSPE